MNKIEAMFVGYHRLSQAKRKELEPIYIEQAAYRAEVCSSCLKLGQCPKCYCDLPAMFFVDKDGSKCPWPKLMDQQQWDQYKQDQKIDIESLIKSFNQNLYK